MRAVVHAAGGSIALRDRPEPVPAAGEVLLRPLAVGICGTDLHPESFGFDPDVVMGHEFVARVVGLGPDAGAPPFPVYQPYALEVAPDGLVWVSATGPSARSLRIVDAAAGDVVGEVATAGAPLFGAFTADGSTLFVVTQTPDALLVVDAAARAIAETVDLATLGCKSAHASKLSPDEAQLFVVCEGDHVREPGALLVLDRATREVLGRTEVGLFPDDVALLPAPEAP